MEIKTKCIVLSTSPYSVIDEKTGVLNEGISIHYLMSDNLNPNDDGKLRGFRPCKEALGVDKSIKIFAVPALYECDFTFATNANGKAQMKLIDLKYLNEIHFEKSTK